MAIVQRFLVKWQVGVGVDVDVGGIYKHPIMCVYMCR